MTINYKTNSTVNQLPEKAKEDTNEISPEIQKKIDNAVLIAIITICIIGYLFTLIIRHYKL